MSVVVRKYRRDGWEVDIHWRLPDGRKARERRRIGVGAKSVAQRWGENRERELILNGKLGNKEVPTLEEFAPRFIDGHARANRQKPSGINNKLQAFKLYLIPMFGKKKLDAITSENVQQLKVRMQDKAPATVNNVLTVLSMTLKKAMEWQVIDHLPCTVKLLKLTQSSPKFYDFDDYETFVSAAAAIDPQAHLIVLLGGDAGLRAGEMRALEWTDINFHKRQVCVERSEWHGHVGATKGNRVRYVPLTRRLLAALKQHRHLKSNRVLCRANGKPLREHHLEELLRKVGRRANLRVNGPHMLRHTFCSHLAMRGAPARAIQELAGHRDLGTTQRYMHLSPSAVVDAIRLLETGLPASDLHDGRGDIVETETVESVSC